MNSVILLLVKPQHFKRTPKVSKANLLRRALLVRGRDQKDWPQLLKEAGTLCCIIFFWQLIGRWYNH